MEKEEKRYSIYPGQIKVDNKTFFGLDYEITDLFLKLEKENRQLETQLKKQQEIIDKVIEYINKMFSIGIYKDDYILWKIKEILEDKEV